MAVHTQISDESFIELLSQYDLGEYQSSEGITAGITNTLYRVHTSTGDWIVILFEALTAVRFWLSRLYDYHLNPELQPCYRKDPTTYQAILDYHRNQPFSLTDVHQS